MGLAEGRSMQTDEELMLAVGCGNMAAFEEIVQRHQAAVWRVACRFIGDAAEAEDVAQEAFLKLLDAAERYKPLAKFTTYLYRIVTRLCIDHFRKKQPAYSGDMPARESSLLPPAEQAELRERDEAVRKALAKLPARQRMALILRYYEGLSGAQIAAAMDASPKAVERLIARGRDALEHELEDFLAE